MGVTFRTGHYVKFVRIGGRTIKDGEAAAIWNMRGEHREVIGPARVRLFYSTIRFLTRHKAESHQYLVVRYRNGVVDHIKGPTSLYCNPSKHDEITVRDCISLESASDFILVQNGDDMKKISDDDVSKSSKTVVIQGPTMFMPSPSEHVHEFYWSDMGNESKQKSRSLDFDDGEDGYAKKTSKSNSKEDASKLLVLRLSNSSMTVPLEIKLSNRYVVQVHINVEYKLKSLSPEVLLLHKDPLARMYKTVIAEGQMLGSKGLTKECKAWNHSDFENIFGKIDAFPDLKQVARDSGFEIVVLNVSNYWICDELKSTVTRESTAQDNILAKIKALEQERKLRDLEQEEKKKEIEAENELSRIRIENEDRLDKEMHEIKKAALLRKAELNFLEENNMNEINKLRDERMINMLQSVKNLDVDMTKILQGKESTTNIGSMLRSAVLAVEGYNASSEAKD
jgi:hypothetical protein